MTHDREQTSLNWNTSTIYASPTAAELEKDFLLLDDSVKTFRSRYLGTLVHLSLESFRDALTSYEKLQEELYKPQCYAHLLFAANSLDDTIKKLSQKAVEFGNRMSRELLFFELEIMAIPADIFLTIISSQELSGYRHFLETVRKFCPHTLAEREEQLLKQKSLVGAEAFTRLFDELSASLSYRMTIEGEEREFTGEELLGLLHHPDPLVREQSFSTFLNGHADQAIVFSSIFNNIILDYGQELELRNYPSPIEPTNISNELSASMVERMMTVTEENYFLAREYFRIKADLLGLKKLKNSDIYAPLNDDCRNYSFAEAKELVMEAFSSFNPDYAAIIEPFFSDKRLDVLPRKGKSGGAFCMGMTPALSPFVLLNFTGNLRDISTLAHELGHGLHFVLAQQQTMLNYHAPLPLAETASVFAEMLLTRLLLQKESDPVVRTSLLCAKIEDIIATTFRQVVLTRFEQKLHLERREGLLATGRICDIWWEENSKLYGDAVDMIPSYRWGWSYISHFIHTRFYCYSYTFAELLVLALYQNYQQSGADFIPRYEAILASGGSKSPADTVRPAGIDLSGPDFWQQGYDCLGELLSELKLTREGTGGTSKR